MAAILTVQNLEKSFGLRRVLGGVSFAVHEADPVGLVGVNGSGKSTLLRILVGDAEPDAGLVTRKRGLAVESVGQEPVLDPERSVDATLRDGLRAHAAAVARLAEVERAIERDHADALLHEQAELHERIAALGGFDLSHELRGLAAALDLPPMAAPVGQLSIGERRRVAIARALLARPELLALDEPTNHLDAATVAWLEERLLAHRGALLLVTHDRYFLDRVATRILELDRGRLHAYDFASTPPPPGTALRAGNYRRVLEKQAERLETEAARERARAGFVRRELDWIRRGPAARTTKQQARIDRFEAAVAAAPGAGERRAGPATLRLAPSQRLGKTVLELRGLSKSAGGKPLFAGVDLVWKPGDRIGVVGPNGAGKTTLVRTILGQVAPDAGEVVVGQNTRFSYLDQGRAELRDDRTVLEEVAGDSDTVFLADGPVHARTFLRMLLFDDGFADTPVGVLSGGERNRVQLAKMLRAAGNFLVLDEPTNDLDLMTLGVLEEALATFPGCALVVSHDRWFLDRVATGILAFEPGGVAFYEGSCSDYLARRRSAPPVPVPAPVPVPDPAPTPTPSRPRRRSFKEQRELESIESLILDAESRVATLEQSLQDPALYASRGAEVPALVASLETARREVERLYHRWQELEALPP
jgi:ATP-binding cassette subfamily F protein uup